MPTHKRGQIGASLNLVRMPKRPKGWIDPESTWGHEYKCPQGHVRLEREKLKAELSLCTSCHMTTGEIQRFQYSRKVKLAKIEAKRKNGKRR